MTTSEELLIDTHIWKSREFAFTSLWSVLERDKTYYNDSLEGLIKYGNVLCKIIGKNDVVGLTRILQHIGLNYEFVASGIRLKENAKLDYREIKIYKKVAPVDYGYEKKFNRVGKEDRYENRVGWAEQILLNNKKEQDKK